MDGTSRTAEYRESDGFCKDDDDTCSFVAVLYLLVFGIGTVAGIMLIIVAIAVPSTFSENRLLASIVVYTSLWHPETASMAAARTPDETKPRRIQEDFVGSSYTIGRGNQLDF
jgi:hypothetical protein